MQKMLVLSAVGSVLVLGAGSTDAAVAEPVSLKGLVHKVQMGGDKAPGARGQEGGSKGTAQGSRDGNGGAGMGQGKGGERGAGPAKGAGADKSAGPEKADRGTQMRSGEKARAKGGSEAVNAAVAQMST